MFSTPGCSGSGDCWVPIGGCCLRIPLKVPAYSAATIRLSHWEGSEHEIALHPAPSPLVSPINDKYRKKYKHKYRKKYKHKYKKTYRNKYRKKYGKKYRHKNVFKYRNDEIELLGDKLLTRIGMV